MRLVIDVPELDPMAMWLVLEGATVTEGRWQGSRVSATVNAAGLVVYVTEDGSYLGGTVIGPEVVLAAIATALGPPESRHEAQKEGA